MIILLFFLFFYTCFEKTLAQFTPKHESGICVMRDNCGKKSLFGGELSCVYNDAAVVPSRDVRDLLVEVCGPKWSGPSIGNDLEALFGEGNPKVDGLCCTKNQILELQKNFKRIESLLSSCNACKENFFNFFCEFTCSPNQSQFVDVIDVQQSLTGKDVVAGVNFYVNSTKAKAFYDSCKEVKISAMNGYAMDLIGGGAKNYKEFLKFLGDEKPMLGGSPFQINFPWDDTPSFVSYSNSSIYNCNDSDPKYHCSCVDCNASCPVLPSTPINYQCKIGHLPCFSFAIIIIYSIGLLLFTTIYYWYTKIRSNSISSLDRVRLLQDAMLSDEEDDGTIYDAGDIMDRPAKGYFLNSIINKYFLRLGYICSTFPASTISIGLLITGLISIGWIKFSIETDPVNLWVSTKSEAYQEKQYFDENFGPFYRIEQVFLVNDTGPVLSYDTLKWWFDVESRVSNISSPQNMTLDDLCLKVIGDSCVTQSVTQYFQGNSDAVSETHWKNQLRTCAKSPVECLPTFQQPLKPQELFGGYKSDVIDAKALISTWILRNNIPNSAIEANAISWEYALEKLLFQIQEEAHDRGLRLSFNTNISLETELNKSSNTDMKVVIISYLVMFLYVSISLGQSFYSPLSPNCYVNSKFTLGISGIAIVLLSVSTSVGFFSLMGLKTTLIIAEVIPFLILAVGVDNIFLLVHELDTVDQMFPEESVEFRVAHCLGRIGPSILLSALCETGTFAFGVFVDMPAVRNFACYAAGAVFVNAFLQITVFVSVLTLDKKRAESGRMDCVPCIKLRANSQDVNKDGFLFIFFLKYYGPWLFKRSVKIVIAFAFITLFGFSLASLPYLKLGLDQRIAIPDDSYLINYFNDFNDYFETGAPVYFVVRDLNVTERKGQQALCGSFTTCNEFSLSNILEQERKQSNISYIAEPAASWIDTYLQWLNPTLDQCCVVEDGEDEIVPCKHPNLPFGCSTCYMNHNPSWNITMNGLPEGKEFMDYFKIWINAPSNVCPLGGKAPYSDAIVVNYPDNEIITSHFRAFHVSLKSQDDYISAYKSARRIAKTVSEKTGINVFPYSVFYIFFDQYISIKSLSIGLVISALVFILVLSSILLGSISTGITLTYTVFFITVDIMGVMSWWNISLNAISLVNIVICIGLSVEFCSHICRAFMVPDLTVIDRIHIQFSGKNKRSLASLAFVGGPVLSGITLTKFIGVSVLAFTRSKIFEIYYFRMWLALVLLAAAHALIFLPIALSITGSEEGYILDDAEDGIQHDLVSRQYHSIFSDDYIDYDDE